MKNEFIEKIKFINYLLENLGHGGHDIALQRLKVKFGGKKTSKNKKEADKIIRESLRGNPMQMYAHPQQFQPFGPMPPTNNGPCFTCQQHGPVARNCPNVQSNFRVGGNSRRGGRGNPNKNFFNKKKNWACAYFLTYPSII